MSRDAAEQIEQTAAEWLIRRQGEGWTQADQAALEHWCAASSHHEVAYLRLELTWEQAGRLQAIAIPGQPHQPPVADDLNLAPVFESPSAGAAPESCLAPPTNTVSRRNGFLFATAAAVLLAVSAGLYLHLSRGPGITYSTGVGAIESVPIADGSSVILNTDSRIEVILAERERRVALDRGEAYFRVAKDPRRPFVVTVGNQRVIAVGTEFSVRREHDDVEVAVTEGKVRIEGTNDPAPLKSPLGEVFLAPGSVAHASDTGVFVQKKTLPEVEAALSWRSGVLMFRRSTLAAAAAEFNRYNAQKIIIADPSIGALPIEGNFRATNASAFAHLLEGGYPIAVQEEPGRILLKPK